MAGKVTSLGISSLDEQHAALASIMAAFQGALAARRPHEDIRAIVATALAAVRAHFEHEEALMGQSGYGAAEAHRFDHDRLMLAVTSLTEDALERRHPAEVLSENADLLRILFRDHIAREDMALADHLLSLANG